MANVGKKKKPKGKALLLGIGLDHDGHKRLTTGENFVLAGMKETHEVMTEKVIKINEKLSAAGKRLEEVSRDEFDNIAHAVACIARPKQIRTRNRAILDQFFTTDVDLIRFANGRLP